MAGKGPKRRPRIGRKPDPDENWNEAPIDLADTLAQCARIRQKIEDAPSGIADRAYEFFEDVDRKVTEVAETISTHQRVSTGQKKALDGWEGGIDKCLDRDD